MTKGNPKLQYEAMLPAEDPHIGPSTVALHAYYIAACAEQKVDITVNYNHSQLWHNEKSCSKLVVGFDDLYGLFNIEALGTSIVRCFCLYMIEKVKDEGLSVGIMDPSLFLKPHVRSNESAVLEYLKGMLNHYEKEPGSLIMFPYKTGDHWLVVVIIPKWSKVIYLDSDRAKQRDLNPLKTVINKAFTLSNYKTKGALSHAVKFSCHRQPNERICGFYAAHHMMLALAVANCEDPLDFEVPSSVLDRSVLSEIRETISSFLMSQLYQ